MEAFSCMNHSVLGEVKAIVPKISQREPLCSYSSGRVEHHPHAYPCHVKSISLRGSPFENRKVYI